MWQSKALYNNHRDEELGAICKPVDEMDQVDDKNCLSVWRKGSGCSPHSTRVTHTPSSLAPDQWSLLRSVWHGHIMTEKRTFRTILWSVSGLNLSVYSLYSLVTHQAGITSMDVIATVISPFFLQHFPVTELVSLPSSKHFLKLIDAS